MKKGLLPIVLAMGSITASTYYITIDKTFKPYYNTAFNWQESTSTFTEWLDIEIPFNYTEYLPEINNQSSDFQQTRTYEQKQERYEQKRDYDETKDIYKDVGSPIRSEQTITKSESRTVNVVPLVDWTDVGNKENCTEWNPSTDTVLFGEEFSQSRQCDQERTRTLEYYIDSNLEHTNTENTIFPIVENQQNFGTNASTGWVSADPSFTEWVDINEGYDHLSWLPDFNNQVVDFQQSRDYSQDQQQFEQAREQNTFTNEYRDVGEAIEHNQTITKQETRNITTTLDVWVNDGGLYDCLEWTPDTDTVVYGEQFTQERDCSRNQVANISYKFEGSELATGTANQTITEKETQQATGTNASSGWVSSPSEFTAWQDTGVGYSHSEWSPAVNNQTNDFQQSRSYSQDQQQFEQQKERNTFTNEYRDIGSPIEHNQTITENESRTVNAVIASWVDSGVHYGCDTWSPDPSTIVYGQTFTQYRDCSQNQTANISYKVSGSEIGTSQVSQTITEQESQQNTGTNSDSGWVATTSTFTTWTDSGSGHSHGSWLPAIENQTTNFTQNQTFKQDQVRYEQKRERNNFTNAIRNVGSPIEHNQTINDSRNRPITVTVGNWSNYGSYINCAGWTPAANTVAQGVQFTQTNNCQIEQRRTRTFKWFSMDLTPKTDSQVISAQQTQQATGTRNLPPEITNYPSNRCATQEFVVTASYSGGTVWGSGPYTDDSDRRVAVIHAGLLSNGQKGIIKQVTRHNLSIHNGSTRNGVTTATWEGDWCTVDLYLIEVLN